MLPVVQRELIVASRRRATFRVRWFCALVAIVMAGLIVGLSGFGSPAVGGRALFHVLTALLFGFCIMEALRNTADSLSSEKREGTLGLLFLTPLKGYDVALGKMAATSLASFYGLLAMLPVLSLSFLMGGVVAGEFWRAVLVLIHTLVSCLVIGLWVSARSWDERNAFMATLGLIAAQWLLLPALDRLLGGPQILAAFSPIECFQAGMDRQYRAGSGFFWASLAALHFSSWGMLAWTAWRLTRRWSDPQRVARPLIRWQFSADEKINRRGLLERNPIQWLVARSIPPLRFFGIYLVFVVIAAFGLVYAFPKSGNYLFGLMVAIHFGLKLWMSLQAPRFFAESRRTGFLEQLLSTPLSPRAIVHGHYQALKQLYMTSFLVLILAESLFLSLASVLGWEGLGIDDLLISFFVLVFANLLLILDLTAVCWVGMWFGLSLKTPGQAVTRTIVCTTVLPLLCVGFPFCGMFGIFLWPVFWISWAQRKLHSEFRRLLTARFGE